MVAGGLGHCGTMYESASQRSFITFVSTKRLTEPEINYKTVIKKFISLNGF